MLLSDALTGSSVTFSLNCSSWTEVKAAVEEPEMQLYVRVRELRHTDLHLEKTPPAAAQMRPLRIHFLSVETRWLMAVLTLSGQTNGGGKALWRLQLRGISCFCVGGRRETVS